MSLLEVRGLTAGYGGRQVVQNASFAAEAGELTGLLGANGSGKTSLLKAVCGILLHAGSCFVAGQRLEGLGPRQLARVCGYIPQRSGIGVDLTAREVVLMGSNPRLGLLERPSAAMRAEADRALAAAGLAGREEENYQTFSEGEKQLCILARALAGGGALAVCALSAGLTMGREAVASYQLFSEEAVDLARFAQEELDPKAVVVTDARHNNELAALAGQNLLCGSPIYLHYHGLDYTRNQAADQAILEAPAGSLVLLAEYGVDYVLAGPFERGSFLVEEGALEELFPKVYDEGTQALYQVNGKEDGT